MGLKNGFEVFPLDNLTDIETILTASKAEGFRHIERLVEEWNSGKNKFSKPNEVLLAVKKDGKFVGVGGLNQEDLLPEPSGRLRRFYILPHFRRARVGSMILEQIMDLSSNYLERLTVYTNNPMAEKFYLKHGFKEYKHEKITHIMDLLPSRGSKSFKTG